ncbi:MAG: porin family protein [Bacteroidota bacterium]
MKKIITTLLLMVGACSLTQAQVGKGQTEFGIGAGYNSAYVVASNSTESSGTHNGFNIGVSADHYFSDAWSIKIRAIYDQKGWSNGFITTSAGQLNGVVYNTNYITVPLVANWHFGKTRGWYLNFGPYVGFLLNATATEAKLDVKEGTKSTDGGLALGIGYKFNLNDKTRFYIEFDGQGGVANIIKDGYVAPNSANVRHSRSSFNIGFNF